jgi:Tol biopolymer transport system component
MPALSPDGKTLYFAVEVLQASGALDYELRSANPEDGPSRLLARIPAHRMPEAGRFHPVISFDGKWLALPLTDGVTTNIWSVATADGAMRPLTDFGHRPTFISRRVSWSPDNHFIYAAVSEGDADIVLLEGLK